MRLNEEKPTLFGVLGVLVGIEESLKGPPYNKTPTFTVGFLLYNDLGLEPERAAS